MQGNGYLENQKMVTNVRAMMTKNTTNFSVFSICIYSLSCSRPKTAQKYIETMVMIKTGLIENNKLQSY